jgi:hypothetical protein
MAAAQVRFLRLRSYCSTDSIWSSIFWRLSSHDIFSSENSTIGTINSNEQIIDAGSMIGLADSIVSECDLVEAAKKLDAMQSALAATPLRRDKPAEVRLLKKPAQ